MEVPEYVISAIITGILTGVIPVIVSFVCLRDRIIKLETKMEPFWKFTEKAVLTTLGTTQTHKEIVEKLLEKYRARTLTYEEAKQLKSVTEKCFEKAKQKQEYSKITYLTLMIGTLEVMIEDLEKKSIHA